MRKLLQALPELPVAALAFVLNAAWEFLQSPLYSDHDRAFGYLLRTRLHCAGGDVLIALSAFALTSLVFRSRRWLIEGRRSPTALFVAVGFVYTVWSEWFNTRLSFSWQYEEAMPLIFGIGLSPLVQWLALPLLLVWILRKARS